MKIALPDNKHVHSLEDLRAISQNDLSDQDVMYHVGGDLTYMYFTNAESGDERPNDATGSGYWIKDPKINQSSLFEIVDDNHDFATNNDEDVTSIDNWGESEPLVGRFHGFKDKKAIQREIEIMTDSICNNDWDTNWNNLTDTEKKVVIKYCVSRVPPNRFFEVYPDSGDRQNISDEFDERNTQARKDRYQFTRTYLFNKIGKMNSLKTLKDAVTEGMVETYIEGIENIERDGLESLYEFIKASSGSSFDGTGTVDGLAIRSYSVIDGSGDTLQDVCNYIADNILIDGKY